MIFCFHNWDYFLYGNRKCIKCNKNQYWKATANLSGGFVNGKRNPRPAVQKLIMKELK